MQRLESWNERARQTLIYATGAKLSLWNVSRHRSRKTLHGSVVRELHVEVVFLVIHQK